MPIWTCLRWAVVLEPARPGKNMAGMEESTSRPRASLQVRVCKTQRRRMARIARSSAATGTRRDEAGPLFRFHRACREESGQRGWVCPSRCCHWRGRGGEEARARVGVRVDVRVGVRVVRQGSVGSRRKDTKENKASTPIEAAIRPVSGAVARPVPRKPRHGTPYGKTSVRYLLRPS